MSPFIYIYIYESIKVQVYFGEEYNSHLVDAILVFINQELLIIEKGILKTDEQAQVFGK